MDEQKKQGDRDRATKRGDGRWMGRFTLPNGKRKAVYGPTKDSVLRQIRKLENDQDAGLPVVSDKRTVGQYLNEWLETVRPRLQPTTYARYETFVRRQLNPEIGRVKLSRLTAHQVQKVYALWRERGLSPTTVKHMHTVLHNALGQAVRWDYVARNVADLVDKPRPAVREMKTLTRVQVGQLLEAAEGDRLEALYVLALSTGLRQGELLAAALAVCRS